MQFPFIKVMSPPKKNLRIENMKKEDTKVQEKNVKSEVTDKAEVSLGHLGTFDGKV